MELFEALVMMDDRYNMPLDAMIFIFTSLHIFSTLSPKLPAQLMTQAARRVPWLVAAAQSPASVLATPVTSQRVLASTPATASPCTCVMLSSHESTMVSS